MVFEEYGQGSRSKETSQGQKPEGVLKVPVEEFQKLKGEVKTLLTEEGKQELKNEVRRRLESLKNTFSPEQLNEMRQLFVEQKEKLTAEFQELQRKVEEEYAERLKQPIQETGKKAMEAIERSGMPEWVKAALTMLGDNPVTRFFQKSYYQIMASIEKVLPEWVRNLPFVKEQIDGSKEMLVKLGARDGIVDAIAAVAKQGRNFEVEWTDFDIAWETRFKPAYEEALKANAKLSSREFVKGEMVAYLSSLTAIAGTTLIVDLGDLAVRRKEQVAGAAQAAPDAPKGAEQAISRLKDFGLKPEWKVGEEGEIPSAGIEYKLVDGKEEKIKIKPRAIEVGDKRYTVQLEPGDAKVLFKPVLSADGKSLEQSVVIYRHLGGPTRGAGVFVVRDVAMIDGLDQNFADLRVKITKVPT